MTGIDDVRAAAGYASRSPALAVVCPHCRAQPGQPCTRQAGRRTLPAPHPSRLAAGPDAQVIPWPHSPPDKASEGSPPS